MGPNDELVAAWYDRRLAPGNLLQDYFKSSSADAGLTWGANVRVSDESSPIRLDPSLATCYHGDYDTSLITMDGTEYLIMREDDVLGVIEA